MNAARNLWVDDVIHKAVIAVDENGTTAAAATGTTVGIVLVILPAPTPLVVDRPFLFFIRHNPTGAILFQGRVVDPAQVQ
jgi:serpin B